MNAFANPEEASPYELPEFPKPGEQVTEYANVEGAVDYQLVDLQTPGHTYAPSDDSTPVVQPAVLQDFKEVLSA